MATVDKRYFWRNDDPLWYKDAVIYELHIRAFYDSNGDGIGDFPGLIQRLDYLQDLGVDTIWLLPFYPSPLKDDGYDISDYTNIHTMYGTTSNFRELIREANYRGLHIVTELVLNHTSDQHPWFQRARRAHAGSQWRNFYVWSDTWDKYKEARIIFKDFEPSNWTWDPVAGAYYWHRFYSNQPDLNYDNPLTRQAIMRVVNFWLRMGISGLRLDAVPYLYERDGTNCENLPESHTFLKELRRQVDEKFQSRMLIAEANQWPEDAAGYFGEGDECHMAYHFPLMPRMFMAIRMEDRFPITDILQNTPPIPEACQWALFLRNHDELTLEMVTDEERDYMYRVYAHDTKSRVNLGIRRRLAPLLNNDRKKIELLNGLLFSLPGTPVIYYGDEIGMGDNFYLGDRNGVRTPMQWSADRNAGFSRANPQQLYLPVIIDPEYHYEAINVAAQQSNPDSLLWWTKHLIALRKRLKALSRGSLEFLYPENRKVLAFIRRYQDEAILVVANLSRLAQHTNLDLAAFNGKVPVEIFGQSEFPPIGEATYSFILSPYTFYWFSLKPREVEGVDLLTPVKEVPVPVLTLVGDWKNLYNRRGRIALGAALLSYIRQHRWFREKTRHISSGDIQDFITVPFETSMAHFIIFQIGYSEGESEAYLVPIGLAMGENADHIINEFPKALIARLALKGKDGREGGVIYDALVEPGFRSALLKAISRRQHFKGEKGEVAASHTRKAFRLLRGSTGNALESALLKGEQSNTSIVYGERFKLKLYRRLEEGISPEVELGRFLTKNETFPNTPLVIGAIEYRPQELTQPITLGILHSYVHSQVDAWDYTLDWLKRYFEQALATPGIEVPQPLGRSLLDICEEDIPLVAKETIGLYLASAELLGQRTAELHLALASATDEPELVPEPFSVTCQRSLYYGMRRFSLEVLQLLRQQLKQLPVEAKADAQKVISLQSTIIRRLQELTRQKITGMRIRSHGDYHLGQLLYTGNDFVIIDFEGEPARHLGERRIKRSPLKDVAGMIRSFHYATHVALRAQTSAALRPEAFLVLEKWAYAWYYWVSATFLKSYLELMADTPILPESRDSMQVLLDAYLLDKAIYEVNYELNNRPDWVKLPLEGILQVLGSHDERAAEGTAREAAVPAPITEAKPAKAPTAENMPGEQS
jgi:maltose alpha-D-glucosyltransferase / alpha-amylase